MKKPKFSPVTRIDRCKIMVDPATFQGRHTQYSETTVQKIVREGYDLTDTPIEVWESPRKKFIVISGHSRWEASERLYRNGDKRLKLMPVKIFLGTKEEAADYAVLESNRAGTAETLKEDLTAYKRAVGKGYNREYLKGIFKPESKLNLLQKLSFLNPSGRFIEPLGEASEKSFPYIRRNAEWVGTLRQMYPRLTNEHETEIFNYIYGSKKALGLNKQTLFDLIEKKAGNMFFDPGKPLNLVNAIGDKTLLAPGNELIREKENEIEKLNRERAKKQELIIKARRMGENNLVSKFSDEIKGIDRAIMNNLQEIDRLKNGLNQLKKAATLDLFSQVEEPDQKVRYSENNQFGTRNLEIWTIGKPKQSLLKQLHQNGFIWSPWNQVFYKKKVNSNDMAFVKSIAVKGTKKSKLK